MVDEEARSIGFLCTVCPGMRNGVFDVRKVVGGEDRDLGSVLGAGVWWSPLLQMVASWAGGAEG